MYEPVRSLRTCGRCIDGTVKVERFVGIGVTTSATGMPFTRERFCQYLGQFENVSLEEEFRMKFIQNLKSLALDFRSSVLYRVQS
jgi:hypothetical protein